MKRKNIILAAAVSAVMTLSAAGAPSVCAVKEAEAVGREAGLESSCTVTDLGKFSSPNAARAIAAGDDGTVYCWGGNRNGAVFCSLNSEGKVKNTYRIDNYNDGKNGSIGVMNAELKQIGDWVYIIYEKSPANITASGSKGYVIIKLDKELNEIEKYDLGKLSGLDTNGSKIAYIKGRKIYLANLDGSDRKIVYTAGSKDKYEHINYVAVTESCIGFGTNGSDDASNCCGVIDLETGKVTVEKQERSITGVTAFNNDTLVWSSAMGRSEGSKYHYYKNRDYYIYDGKNFSVFTAQEVFETLTIDADGNFITSDIGNGKLTLRFYKDGKAVYSFDVTDADDGFCTPAINGGVIAVSTTVYPEGADTGWHKVKEGVSVAYQEPFPINTHLFAYGK